MTETNPRNGKPVRTSAGRFMGKNVIYGAGAEHGTPYMTRYWFGRLRLHIFHRGDQDPDCHDHPWGFWTFPFRPYVEEVVELVVGKEPVKRLQVVPAFRWSYRPATHTHRVIGPWGGKQHDMWARQRPSVVSGSIPTLVWREHPSRKWGFLKSRDGQWCWVAWRDYVFHGGKEAPCGEPDYMRLPPEEYDALFGTRNAE